MNDRVIVTVYAIAKNESKFVDMWFASMKEADHIVVLDTGSEDDTVEKLRSHGVTVYQQNITPWRFDVARNLSMEYIPTDTNVCVCTDLDEVLRKGWAETIRTNWNNNIDRIVYTYIWSWDEQGKPAVTFNYEKIHKPNSYHWEHAVHEILVPDNGVENKVYLPQIILEHHPDPTKSRSNYLELLELDVKERPQDDRSRFYYARELMFHRRYAEAATHFKHHLTLHQATWEPERCASMRFLAKCTLDEREKERWLYRAIAESPYLREPWYDMAYLQYTQKNWKGVVWFAEKALEITVNPKIYTNDPMAWNETLYELLYVAYWELGDYKTAIKNAQLAFTLNPYNKRVAQNLQVMLDYNINKGGTNG